MEYVFINHQTIRIADAEGREIVMWERSEWREDPSIVPSIVNAVRLALAEGPEAVAERIDRPVSERPTMR